MELSTRSIGLEERSDPTVGFARTLKIILPIALIAGTLDITDALVFVGLRGITPKMVFQFIASGLIGIQAARGLGAFSVALGVAIHYFIATWWTALFYAASRKTSLLTRRPVVSGLLYGAFVYVVMNFVVLPLSRIPHGGGPPSLASRVNGVLAILFCIGLPVSLLVARWDRQRQAEGLRRG
jgi:hypothetical protein